jgi:hypothetical protein
MLLLVEDVSGNVQALNASVAVISGEIDAAGNFLMTIISSLSETVLLSSVDESINEEKSISYC